MPDSNKGNIVTISGIKMTINGVTRELTFEYKDGRWVEIARKT